MQESEKLCYLNASPWQLLKKTTLILLPAIFMLLAFDLVESSVIANNSEHLLQLYGYAQPLLILIAAFAVAIAVRTNMHIVRLVKSERKGLLFHLLFGLGASVLLTLCLMLCMEPVLNLLGLGDWLLNTTSKQARIEQQQVTLMLQARIAGIFALVWIWQISSALRAMNDCHCSAIYLFTWMSCKLAALLWLSGSLTDDILPSLGNLHFMLDGLFALVGGVLLLLRHKSAWGMAKSRSSMSSETLLVIMQQLIPACSLAILTYIAAQYSSAFIGIFTLTFKIEALTSLIPMVLTASLPALVGINFWADKKARVWTLLRSAFHGIVVIQFLLAAALLTFESSLFTWLCPDCEQRQLLAYFMLFLPISYIGSGIAMVYTSCLNAMGKSMQATVLLCAHRLVLIPLGAILGLNMIGLEGLFVGLAFANMLAGLSAYLHANKQFGARYEREQKASVIVMVK